MSVNDSRLTRELRRRNTRRGKTRVTDQVAAVSHAIAILWTIHAAGELSRVNEIARRVGLHKSTVSRLLATLESHGFVERNSQNGRFDLGVQLVALVRPLLANLDVVKVGRPVLQAMARESGETVCIAMRKGDDAIMLEQTLGERAVRHYAEPGTIMPAHCTAAGKVFLASFDEVELDRFLDSGLKRYTPYTKTDRDKLLHDLGKIRKVGYAINDQEYEIESCGIAAPVLGLGGDVVAALTAAVPKHRFGARQQRKLAAMTVHYAAVLSRRLGNTPAPGTGPIRARAADGVRFQVKAHAGSASL